MRMNRVVNKDAVVCGRNDDLWRCDFGHEFYYHGMKVRFHDLCTLSADVPPIHGGTHYAPEAETPWITCSIWSWSKINYFTLESNAIAVISTGICTVPIRLSTSSNITSSSPQLPPLYNLLLTFPPSALSSSSKPSLYNVSNTPLNPLAVCTLFNFSVGVSNSFSIVNGSLPNHTLFTLS